MSDLLFIILSATAEKKGKRSCGQCSNCQRADACGHCSMCRERKKFGRSQDKCQHQQCLKFGVGKSFFILSYIIKLLISLCFAN